MKSHLATVVLLAFVPGCWAAVWPVFPGESIQSAVFQADDYDTVLVHEGTYHESVVLYGKDLVIAGEFLLDGDTAHIGRTTILGEPVRPDTGSALVIAYGESDSTRIVGLTLQGRTGTRWAWGPADSTGGAAYVFMSAARFEHCVFSESSAHYGGGLLVVGNADWTTAKGILTDCVFRACIAAGDPASTGGGVYARACSLIVRRCTFENDTAYSCGGLRVTSSVVTVDSCRFASCFSGNGALLVMESIAVVSRCLFEGNDAWGEIGTTDLHFIRNSGAVVGCWFLNNATPHSSIVWEALSNETRFSGNVVEGMRITTLGGGTLLVADDSRGDIGYNLFRDNESIYGGVITCIPNSRPRLHHNVFAGNRSLSAGYGSVVRSIQSHVRLDSNIIAGNLAPVISLELGTQTVDARNNWWGHPSGPYHPQWNPGGQGDTLYQDSILFIPWLTELPDTSVQSEAQDRQVISSTWELTSVYPNPFNSQLLVAIAGFTPGGFDLSLYDILGRKADTIQSGALSGMTLRYQSPPGLSSGIYFLVARDSKSVQTRKVLFLK